jgi:uncharacterized protein (TIGR00251 family)
MIREHPNGIVFNVFVQPRSSKNKIVGRHGDALKVKVTAPPVEGAANKMCLKFLAKCLATPYFRLQIITGQNSRTKQILLRSEQDSPSEKERELSAINIQSAKNSTLSYQQRDPEINVSKESP